MKFYQKEISLPTFHRGFHLVTDLILDSIPELHKIELGQLKVFIKHTSRSMKINENADPDVCSDIINKLNKMVALNDGYKHAEGNSAAHIKASLMGFSVSVIVEGGKLQLGTWQGIYFAEFDGARNRKVWVKSV